MQILHVKQSHLVLGVILTAAVLAAAGCGGGKPGKAKTRRVAKKKAISPAAKQVKQAFGEYRLALVDGDGKSAADRVSSGSIDLYGQYRELSLGGSEETIKGLSMINRLQVLLVRHRVPLESLKAMDGRGLFVYAVDNGWIGKKVVRIRLAEITALGRRATAKVTDLGKPTGDINHFIKEADGWKVDLLPTMKGADQLFQRLAKKSGQSENEYIISVITSLSGRQVTDMIWQPPVPPTAGP